MAAPGARLRLRAPSPALRRARWAAATVSDASERRRVAWIWGLLFLNVLPYSARSSLVPMPVTLGKVVTQGALVAAVVLAISVNRKVLVRPNLFLLLLTVLCVTSLMMSVRGYFGFGSTVRAARLCAMVAVLWLLTPWWGRRDLLLLRYHRRALAVVLAVVVAGAVLMPGTAFGQAGGGRLGGAIWPVPPTQVAEYAAGLAGTTVVLWLAGAVRSRGAVVVTAAGVVLLVLTHTRTALVGFLLGLLVAGLSLFLTRARVRRALAVTAVVGALVAVTLSPFLSSWFLRGESTGQLANLTGRAPVWTALLAQPRTAVNTAFGFGLSNDSFNGLSIDSSWYSTYLDQGLAGDVLVGALLLLLVLLAVLGPRGPRRAVALFLVTYCVVASFTETGLGQASPYMLDLAVAMALLMPPLSPEPPGAGPLELPPL